MNNRRLGKLLKKHFPDRKVEGQLGLWQIDLSDGEFAADEAIPKVEDQPEENIERAAEANGKPVEHEPEQVEAGQENVGAGERLPAVLVVMTDERANRMRIMMPIRPFDHQLTEDLQLALIALHANYDRALDARYAVHDGVLWSAYLHPLGSLTPNDLASALSQVQTLRETTGTAYSSGNLIFAPQADEEDEGPEKAGEDQPRAKSPDDNVT